MSQISRYVSDKLLDITYQRIEQLKDIDFKYGGITYFSKNNIDKGQEGYRYNAISGEVINEWPDDKYVIIGIDNSVGDGGEPIMIKVDEDGLPVYHFEDLNYEYPEIIADSLEDYIRINNLLFDYMNGNNSLEIDSLGEKIKNISGSSYWDFILETIGNMN